MTTKNPKFAFGKAPETFKRAVEVIDIDGGISEIEFIFKYRTKKQFAELLDEGEKAEKAAKAAKANDAENNSNSEKSGSAENSDKFYSDLITSNDKKSADYVLKIAKGWDLSDEFCAENLLKLEDDHPGSLQAVAQSYAKAVSEVRTKNLKS